MYQVGTINFSFVPMLSKAQNKYIRSLTQQKYRKEHNVFIAEGDKIAREWLSSPARIQMIVCLEGWAVANRELTGSHSEAEMCIVTEDVLVMVSTLQTPNQVLLVVHMPAIIPAYSGDEWCLALDEIQDPGNMGTLIRIADWFGIRHIVCSPGCVDVYNPKVVQAAMGGHLRVALHTAPLDALVADAKIPVLAAVLGGTNVYDVPEIPAGILIIGNESKGISPELAAKATHKVTIPRRGGAESLNAAVSAGILCALLIPR
jgi:RNA methyltransferase, TrmH family